MLIGLAAIAGVVVALAGTRVLPDKSAPAQTEVQTVAAPLPYFSPRMVIGSVLEGRLMSISGSMLIVEDVFGAQQRVQTGRETDVARGAGHTYVSDHDITRLQPGDALWIAGNVVDSDVFQGGRVNANGFIGRDGIIEDKSEAFIDVRLRKSRLATEFEDEPTRFLLDPSVQVQSPRGITMGTAIEGTGAHIQGFIAYDGVYVALFLWLHER
jgi:hypothetical protein